MIHGQRVAAITILSRLVCLIFKTQNAAPQAEGRSLIWGDGACVPINTNGLIGKSVRLRALRKRQRVILIIYYRSGHWLAQLSRSGCATVESWPMSFAKPKGQWEPRYRPHHTRVLRIFGTITVNEGKRVRHHPPENALFPWRPWQEHYFAFRDLGDTLTIKFNTTLRDGTAG